MFLARIYVTLKPNINDPQGQTVLGGLKMLGFDSVEAVRMGKYIEVRVAEGERARAEEQVSQMCGKLLANPVMEDVRFELDEIP